MIRRGVLLCGLTLAWAAIAGVAVAGAAPVALVVHVTGGAKVKTGGHWTAAHPQQRLSTGDQVVAGAGQQVAIVMLGSNLRYRVTAGQKATVQAKAITGATALGGAKGPSARVAERLGGARTGAIFARAPKPPSRLTPTAACWIRASDPTFAWSPVKNAQEYRFSLLDGQGNLLWSERTAQTQARYPAALPPLQTRVPYIWKLAPILAKGALSADSRWGVITLLPDEDAARLQSEAAALQEQIKAEPQDETLPALYIELFRDYGVLGTVIEQVELLELTDQPGVSTTLRAAYEQVGPYAQFLSPLFNLVGNAPEPETEVIAPDETAPGETAPGETAPPANLILPPPVE